MKSSALIRSTIKNGHYVAWTGHAESSCYNTRTSNYMCTAVGKQKKRRWFNWFSKTEKPTIHDVIRVREHIVHAIQPYSTLLGKFINEPGVEDVPAANAKCKETRKKALTFWEDLAVKLESQGD